MDPAVGIGVVAGCALSNDQLAGSAIDSINLPFHNRHRAKLDTLVRYPGVMTRLHNLSCAELATRISSLLGSQRGNYKVLGPPRSAKS